LEKISLQKIKWLRSLRNKKTRDELCVFVVEGEKIVKELIEQFPEKIEFILTSQDLIEEMELSRFKNSFVGSVSDFEKITNLNSPPNIIAVASKLDEKEIKIDEPILVLDGIQDPGNFGTIIRTADWFGFDQIVCSENTVDVYNQKVIQASMGSIFRVNVSYHNLPDFLKKLDCKIHGALLEGSDLNSVSPTDIKVLILGSEGKGISNEVLPFITNPISIKGSGNAESLNVAIATGIFLHKWVR
jgi:TrmH family RNA methyltransferase